MIGSFPGRLARWTRGQGKGLRVCLRPARRPLESPEHCHERNDPERHDPER